MGNLPFFFGNPAGHLRKVLQDLGQQDVPSVSRVLRGQPQPGEPGRGRAEEESRARGDPPKPPTAALSRETSK